MQRRGSISWPMSTRLARLCIVAQRCTAAHHHASISTSPAIRPQLVKRGNTHPWPSILATKFEPSAHADALYVPSVHSSILFTFRLHSKKLVLYSKSMVTSSSQAVQRYNMIVAPASHARHLHACPNVSLTNPTFVHARMLNPTHATERRPSTNHRNTISVLLFSTYEPCT